MLDESAGHIEFGESMPRLNESSLNDPFQLYSPTDAGVEVSDDDIHATLEVNDHQYPLSGNSEEAIAKELFQGDIGSGKKTRMEKVVSIFERNRKVASRLKQLYKTCQITGDQFVFAKTNNQPYLEVHHLIPLSEGGSDNPANLVVVSAHIHKMLHYADVEGLNLSDIEDNKLDIKINGESFTITWLPEHADIVTRQSMGNAD